MDIIFHEKQEGALCAQHCLNSLLQGSYYNAVDLAEIARELDEIEREAMAMGNVNSPEYLDFLQQPSSNFDDSGYFSVQVICKALQFWGLQMVPINSQAAENSRIKPTAESAYICNQQNHWLTIRKLGNQWFNLNSVKACPELISDTYLSLLLAQLREEGYSIFVISGDLPDCEANTFLEQYTISTSEYNLYENKLRTDKKKETKRDKEKKTETEQTVDITPAIPVDAADVRLKRLNYFSNKQEPQISTSSAVIVVDGAVAAEKNNENNDMSEEEMLQIAMAMSMEPMQ